jgi:hypothetical protein
MPAKVRISGVGCPLEKWGPVEDDKSIKPYNIEEIK